MRNELVRLFVSNVRNEEINRIGIKENEDKNKENKEKSGPKYRPIREENKDIVCGIERGKVNRQKTIVGKCD